MPLRASNVSLESQGVGSFMRNLLENFESCAALGRKPSYGETAYPRMSNLVVSGVLGKVARAERARDQYFGRCEVAHSRACGIGSRGGKLARSVRVVDRFSIPERQRQNAGNFRYMDWPSSVSPKAKVHGSM